MEEMDRYVIFYSPILDQKVFYDTKVAYSKSEDQVEYNAKELKLLTDNNIEITKLAHSVKKIFGGEIWKILGTESKQTEKSTEHTESDNGRVLKLQSVGESALGYGNTKPLF